MSSRWVRRGDLGDPTRVWAFFPLPAADELALTPALAKLLMILAPWF
jgi:hypothetical protein